MKKIFIIATIIFTFISCHKSESPKGSEGICINYENGFEYPHLDIVNGDKTTFTTSHSAYVCSVTLYADDAAYDMEYKFQEDSKICDFEIGTIKTVDNKLFEVNINPTSKCKYRAIGVMMDTTPQMKISKGAFLGYFDK